MLLKKRSKLLLIFTIYFFTLAYAQDNVLKQLQYLEKENTCQNITLDEALYIKCLENEFNVVNNIDIINELANKYKNNMQINKAIIFYKLSAKVNSSFAMYSLGKIYNQKESSEFYDKNLALKWFLKASKNKYKDSTCLSSKLYKKIEPQKEIDFLNSEVKYGNVKALTCIAHKFLKVNKYEDAKKWFLRALEKGDLEASYYLSYINFRFLNNEEEAMYYYSKLISNVEASSSKNILNSDNINSSLNDVTENSEIYTCLDLKKITRATHKDKCLDYLTKKSF